MIVFRADGNSHIGMGHIMRCLSIADAAKMSGEDSVFILSSDDCKGVVSSRGYEVSVLNSDYSKMEPGDILPALEVYEPAIVFVDSYFVTPEYMKCAHDACCHMGCKLIYVDDRCYFPYGCDVLLNYNIFGKKTDYEELYLGNTEPLFLLGTSYTPLRTEFQKSYMRIIAGAAQNVLISTGGADTEHLTIDIVQEAALCPDYTFHFVVGMMNSDRITILKLSESYENIVVHENVKRMDELMLSCDVAVSAAGSTLYELCATGTPTITYVLADNQIPAAKEFDAQGIIKNCGDIREMGNKELAKCLVEEVVSLAEDHDERKRISEIMCTVVDGKGAERILKSVRELKRNNVK